VAPPDAHFASEAPIAITLYYLPDEPMQGDIESFVKNVSERQSVNKFNAVMEKRCLRYVMVDDDGATRR
jgi:hypothetical protein